MSDKNIALVQKKYEAFGRGDVPAILEHIDDKMTRFGIIVEDSDIGYHAQITEKQKVPQFFQSLAKEVEFTKFEPHSFAAGGEHVYCSVRAEATVRKNGKKLKLEDIHHFTFKNGRVVEWRGSEDTALVIAALKA